MTILSEKCRQGFFDYIYRSLGQGLPLTLPIIQQVNGRDQRLRPQFAVETQLKQKIFLIHSLFIPYSCRHCQI